MEIIHPASPTKYLEEPASEEAPPVENGLSDKGEEFISSPSTPNQVLRFRNVKQDTW